MFKSSTLTLLAIGVIAGAGGLAATAWVFEATSTDEFCLSCHNHDITYQRYQTTSHYSNASGISATCADCHIPHDLVGKTGRKIAAIREVWGHVRGVIDTDEKYLAHREEMAERELERFYANDSANCRYCHNAERMDFDLQGSKAARKHAKMDESDTCVDCHDGIAHPEPDEE